jgi:rubrerythrin
MPAQPPTKPIVTPIVSALGKMPERTADDKMTCERCGADMYRMHAVWRCPACRFNTDCCGW